MLLQLPTLIDKRIAILYTKGRGEKMLKKTVLFLVLCLALLLTGCDVDKTITIANSQPEDLFLLTLTAIKKDISPANLSFDVPSKKITYTACANELYPNSLDISFAKNGTGTDVSVTAKNTDENKINNLKELLTKSLDAYNLAKKKANQELEPVQQILRINSTK